LEALVPVQGHKRNPPSLRIPAEDCPKVSPGLTEIYDVRSNLYGQGDHMATQVLGAGVQYNYALTIAGHTIAYWSVVVGPVLVCIGLIIQFIDWRANVRSEERLAEIHNFIETIDLGIDELKKGPKLPAGANSKDGLPIPEAIDMLQDAAFEANLLNR